MDRQIGFTVTAGNFKANLASYVSCPPGPWELTGQLSIRLNTDEVKVPATPQPLEEKPSSRYYKTMY